MSLLPGPPLQRRQVTKSAERLLFVYNADSGLFNVLADVAHKLLSPRTCHCRLCALTHSPLAMRAEWRDFLTGLGVECRFLHRDEFAAQYPGRAIGLPAVLCETKAGVQVCIDAEALNSCSSLAALERLILEATGLPPP